MRLLLTVLAVTALPAAASADEGVPDDVVTAPNRSGPPPVQGAAPLGLPAPVIDTLRPGVRILWVPVAGVRRVEVTVRLGQGQLGLDGGPTPANELLGEQWAVATRHHSALDLEQAQTAMDASIWAGIGLRDSYLALSVPADDLSPALALMGEVLREPTFPASELKRSVHDLAMWFQGVAPNSLSTVSAYAERYAWYPADDPRGADRIDLSAYQRVRRGDLVARHKRLLADSPIDVLVVGDVQPDSLRPQLAALVDGLGSDVPWAPAVAPRPPRPSRVIGVDLPSADQATITVRTPAPGWATDDAPAFQAVQHAIGGTFLSRLNANLREDKGYTYGGYSAWLPGDADGAWSFDVEVGEAVVGEALTETLREIDLMVAQGVRADELAAFTVGRVSDWNLTLGTADDADRLYSTLVARRASLSDATADLQQCLQVDAADTASVAARWLGGPERLIVVVGDRSAIADQVQAVVGPVTWYTPQQAMLGQLDGDGGPR